MQLIQEAFLYIAYFLLGVLVLYLGARLISAAFFRSLDDYISTKKEKDSDKTKPEQ